MLISSFSSPITMAQTQRPFLSDLSFVIIFFFFFTLNPFSLQVSASVYKRFQLLSKDKTQPTTTTTSSVLSLTLHPYSSIVKPPYKNYSDVVLSRLEADKARAKFINAKLHHALSKFNRSDRKTDIQPEDLETPVIGSNPPGEYLAQIGVDNQEFHLIPDTGSSINWLQCQPCNPCFNQPDPIFDPSKSSTYRNLSCASPQCTSLRQDERLCDGDTCIFVARYGDSSISAGPYATETLSFGSSGSVPNIAIGCGVASQSQSGLFGSGAAGILGLGLTAVSLPSQIKAQSFSYCLVDRDSDSSSTLEFNSAPPGDSVLVPFNVNQGADYYYVELTGIIVGGEVISIPASVYQIGPDGGGGIILDSGTTFTYLPAQVYNSVRDTFVKHAQNLPPQSGISPFDACYDLSSAPDGSVPTMSFQFSGDKTVPLKKENYLVRVDASGKTFCLAFQVASLPVSIIGNIPQQGMRITYDLANKGIGFSPDKCQ